jgi:para-aminobenzoate synthetase/4-amino-4-deoxychorismate lyase
MIVDLMRNDLGRVAATGTVRVPALLAVQPHPGVWHLVSTVSAQLRAEVGDAALLRATFPPGSVTGAPKLRALTAIADLEPLARGAYTGAIGFASPLWGAEFSVAIRTFEITGGRIELGVGGGVTADSVPMLEWGECLDKAAPLVAAIGAHLDVGLMVRPAEATAGQLASGLLETILAVDEVVHGLSDHLARLDRSCRELYGTPAPGGLADELRAAAAAQPGRLVLRVVLAPVGRTVRATVTRASAGVDPEFSKVSTVVRPGGLWRHKWADRQGFGVDESRLGTPLYVAADGTVLETSRGNVFLIDSRGALITPPLRDDLLPGVTRRALLDLARDTGRPHEVRPFRLDELLRHAAFWTSSVSLVVPIHGVDGDVLPRADDLAAELRRQLSPGGATVR